MYVVRSLAGRNTPDDLEAELNAAEADGLDVVNVLQHGRYIMVVCRKAPESAKPAKAEISSKPSSGLFAAKS